MKQIVHVGLEMHIDRAGVFTRDLWPCCCVFAEHCPDRAQDMYRALEPAVEPTSDPAKLPASVESFGRWVPGEAQRKLAPAPATAIR